ncbi:hypothetical protein B9Z19DRAFT_1123860 [Tuber borchii]|uniref:Uncharacterized protein n=1 Tax=Tuber borchii TaxID=42251 RepID=A0A2T6ZXL5_TUBBO|nr:hypothetical protein B9Z19DRAFT_1123860 [Tuber borchii]
MVLKYKSGEDAEAMNRKLDTKGARSTPLPAHTSTALTATLTSMAKPKFPLASMLRKRTSTDAQSPDEGDAGNKKVRREYLEEDTISDYESDEKPITNRKAYRHNILSSPHGFPRPGTPRVKELEATKKALSQEIAVMRAERVQLIAAVVMKSIYKKAAEISPKQHTGGQDDRFEKMRNLRANLSRKQGGISC